MAAFPRIVCSALIIALVLGTRLTVASAATEELLAYRSSSAADGSVRLELDFDGPAPPTEVIHAYRDQAKIVLVGVIRGPDLPASIAQGGTIKSGSIASFAHIGLVVNLELTRDVRPRTETIGNRVIVHVPDGSSDEEAHVTINPLARAQGVTIVRLSYADVSEIAGLIKSGVVVPSVDFFTAQSPFVAPTPASGSSYSSSSSSQVTNATPTYVTLPTSALIPKDTAQGVFINDNVSVDRRLNAVILRGTPDEIAPYERMIALVDTPRRSVLLETQVVELTETGAYDLGINYSPNGTLATATFNAGNTIPSGVSVNSTAQGGSKPIASLSLGAQLQALQQKGQAKILAQPRILAADNRIAAILSGEAVPIFNTVVVPSGGAPLVQQQIQYINVGVSLEILPRISADGNVTVDVFSEVSSIIDYVGTTPRIAVRQELTTASANDGQSILMGGLMQDQEIKQLSKIPGLGDLPLIGPLFQQTSMSDQKTNLYLVITPHVLTKTSTAAQPPSPSP
jgi:general secretion pathway protein D